MTTSATASTTAQLTALRAAWLFDGAGSALIPDPVVLIEGGTIRGVSSGGPGWSTPMSIWSLTRAPIRSATWPAARTSRSWPRWCTPDGARWRAG